jgi:hypothetical protein
MASATQSVNPTARPVAATRQQGAGKESRSPQSQAPPSAPMTPPLMEDSAPVEPLSIFRGDRWAFRLWILCALLMSALMLWDILAAVLHF